MDEAKNCPTQLSNKSVANRETQTHRHDRHTHMDTYIRGIVISSATKLKTCCFQLTFFSHVD